MKKIGLFGLMALVAAVALPGAASAQTYYSNYSNYPYYQQGYYSSYDYNYPYYNGYYDNNYGGDVVCTPDTQTVEEGRPAYFTARGGDGDYRWEADGHTYSNRGPRFSYVFDDTGTYRVKVRSDNETDTCTVRVVRNYSYPSYTYPTYPTYPTYTQPVSVVSAYVPQALPNTGFPPISSAAFAFAVVLLLAAGLVLTPHAKKVITAWR